MVRIPPGSVIFFLFLIVGLFLFQGYPSEGIVQHNAA